MLCPFFYNSILCSCNIHVSPISKQWKGNGDWKKNQLIFRVSVCWQWSAKCRVQANGGCEEATTNESLLSSTKSPYFSWHQFRGTKSHFYGWNIWWWYSHQGPGSSGFRLWEGIGLGNHKNFCSDKFTKVKNHISHFHHCHTYNFELSIVSEKTQLFNRLLSIFPTVDRRKCIQHLDLFLPIFIDLLILVTIWNIWK